MRSLRSRHIWLIQPQDPLPTVTPIDGSGGDSVRFSPAWDLLCLHAFILGRTGHTCDLIDVRLYESTSSALSKLTDRSNPGSNGLALIYTTVNNLGPAVNVVEFIRNNFPDVTVVIFGPYVSSFPDTLNLIPNIHYGLSGDPEIILRNLLDFTDIEHRLKLTPGLIIPGQTKTNTPHWASNLNGLSLPEWNKIRWSTYHSDIHSYGARVEARLSRGHTDQIIDVVYSLPNEPLRVWPLNLMAQLLQKCPRQGISEVFFSDPPGFWTPERVLEWCRQLALVRNTQAWAFQILPRLMSDEEIIELSSQGCKRIEFIIPSCNTERRREFGIVISNDELNELMTRLSNNKIKPQLIYWIQGPDENADEAENILRNINALHVPQFSIYPFPFHHDSLLYQSRKSLGLDLPPLTDWIAWAQHSDQTSPPPALWRGIAGLEQINHMMLSIQRHITHSPWVRINRLIQKYLPQKFTASFLKRSSSALDRKSTETGKSGIFSRLP